MEGIQQDHTMTPEQDHQVRTYGWAEEFVLWVDAVAPGKWDELNAAFDKWRVKHGEYEGAATYLDEVLGPEVALAWRTYHKIVLGY
jgi:hypothetical protein